MARIRTIKPEFWSSSKVGRVSRDARLLFLGLLNEADDEGRLLGQAKRLAGIIFPFDDDVDAAKVTKLITELHRIGLVIKYEVDGALYLSIVGFSEHQKIDKRTPSKLPEPPLKPSPQLLAEDLGEPADLPAEPAQEKALEQGTGNREVEQGNGKGSFSCSELVSPDSEPKTAVLKKPEELTNLKFVLCGGSVWYLAKTKLDEYQGTFPDMDVGSELRKAGQWLSDNSKKRKTASGMPTFLGGWLTRSQNRGTAAFKPSRPMKASECPEYAGLPRL